MLAVVLLGGLTMMAVTGLLSYAAYDPRLPGNDQTPGAGLLQFYLFSWPTDPSWLYRVNQGVHVTLGLALLPVVLAKLWSVLPRLFAWPPVRSLAQLLERVSLIMVVGGVLFEFATGILDIQNYYVFPFSFYTAHLYGAWVFIAGLVIHVILKFPRMRGRPALPQPAPGAAHAAGRDPARGAGPRPDCGPARPGRRRRSPAAGCWPRSAAASLTLAGLVGRPVDRRAGPAGPRCSARAACPPTARHAAGEPDGGRHRPDRRRGRPGLPADLVGARTVTPDPRRRWLALPQRPWAADRLRRGLVRSRPRWTGVRLADLARLAGVTDPAGARVESIERGGSFKAAACPRAQVSDPQSLLALRVNGADLSRDHGYPARMIIPARRACTTPSGSARSSS